MNDLLRRQAATEATLARFRDKPLVFGRTDCVAIARWHLVQLGYLPPPLPKYRTAIGAARAASKVGGMEAMLDALLERITPAAALLGDLAMLEGDKGLPAIVICAGGKMMGWHEDSDRLVAMTPLAIKGAWRV
ncbi:DUF6950 family protein [Sphingomonas sanxanigenens]|uniref:DUF6950 domain-containing protein n=1 Tax=Sphingomonas sanxanigenens DSM 19645 = NX02 TaxID=1123269 RepID=W0AJX1_9SPHN|nr:hypothetical protein [Sphingomonas sanxanigenens]AHE57436.1 hypothetical protein NX02_29360 [Sphingomonas sanxanigenens DSM 19645 = NX02]